MMPSLVDFNPDAEKEGGSMPMTRRELEIEAYSQKLFAEDAEQKAEDLEAVMNFGGVV
jgi:hypothetical protein